MGIRLLLDTHALVWAINAPDQLSARARGAIQDLGNVLFVSSVSAYEIANKYHLGKWPEVADIVENYELYLDKLRAVRLPVSEAHALAAGLLPYAHRDPFDRLLIGQATHEELPVVTLDPAIRNCPGVKTIW